MPCANDYLYFIVIYILETSVIVLLECIISDLQIYLFFQDRNHFDKVEHLMPHICIEQGRVMIGL